MSMGVSPWHAALRNQEYYNGRPFEEYDPETKPFRKMYLPATSHTNLYGVVLGCVFEKKSKRMIIEATAIESDKEETYKESEQGKEEYK